jgi:S-adenosylmethionine hydrolase
MKRSTKSNRLIVLLTDFGRKDAFVGTMKGVILGINPNASIVDLAHEVPPQDVDAGAYVLWSSYTFFPKGSVFVVVVDPGVGSRRRIVCAEGRNHLFVTPDNGVLKYLLADQVLRRVWEVKNKSYFLQNVSQTFHGRDILSPVAGHLSLGLRPSKLGKEIVLPRSRNEFAFLDKKEGKKFSAKVIYIDRFGNLATNLRVRSGTDLMSETLRIRIKNCMIQGMSRSYAEGSRKLPLALVNSSNLVEIGVKNARASELLGVKVGERVLFEFVGR